MPQDDTAPISICPAFPLSHLLLNPGLELRPLILLTDKQGERYCRHPTMPGVSLRVLLDAEGQPCFVARDVALALGYALPSKAVLDHFNYAKILKSANSAGLTSSPVPSPSSPTQRFRIGTFDFQLRGLSIIPEADVYRFFMRPHFTEAHGNIAPNLGDYEVAYHTSEAPGLPALQGRLPSPQDGRVAIRLLPLAGLLLRRADMMDKVVHIMDPLSLCGYPAAIRLWLPLSRLWLAASPLSYPPSCAHSPAIRMGLFLPGLPCSRRHQLQVAEISGKRHDHMLRDIEQFLTQQPEIFIESNFGCNGAEYRAVFDASA